MLINAGTSEVNGKYIWNDLSNEFDQYTPNNGFSIRLSYDANDAIFKNSFGWRIGKYDPNSNYANNWVPYYSSTGNINIRRIEDGNIYWSTKNCHSGLSQPPQTFGKGRFIRTYFEDPLSGYYYFNTQTNFWTSISNPNVQIRAINSNYFIGIVSGEIFDKYYMLYQTPYNYPSKQIATPSQPINYPITITNAKIPCSYEGAQSIGVPPATATIDPYLIGTELFTLRIMVELDRTPCTGQYIETNFIDKTITIGCASGSISVNNEVINSGFSRTYSIPNSSFSVKNDYYTYENSVYGIENLLFIQGLTTNAAISGNVILNWDTPGQHDLYIEYGMSSSLNANNELLKTHLPVGAWVSNGYYLGTRSTSNNTISVVESI
jgi:hypothetical protein